MHFKSKQNVVHFSLIYSCKCAKSLKQKQSSSYGKDDLFCFMFWSFNVGGMTHCSSTWTHTEQPLPSSPVQEQDYEWFTCRTCSVCQPGQIPPPRNLDRLFLPMRQKWSFQHSHSWSRWSVTSLKINEGSFCWASKATGNTSSRWTPLWSHDQESTAYSTDPPHPPKKCLKR